MSIADKLSLTDSELEELLQENGGTSTFFPAAIRLPEGGYIISLGYQTDYRGQEERGIEELRKAITSEDPRRFQMTEKAQHYIAYFTDANAFVLSTRPLRKTEYQWGEVLRSTSWKDPEESKEVGEYAKSYTTRLPYTQWSKSTDDWKLKLPALRAEAKELGIKPIPRRRDDLLNAINAHPVRQAQAEHPNRWPAWFYDGEDLVIRSDSGPVASIVEGLIEAAKNGTLAMGNGSGPFYSGLVFYDARDETPQLVADREAAFDWYDARMAELAPVEEELKSRGFKWYFLGNPRTAWNDEPKDTIKYWLNGHSVRTESGSKHPTGWYTLDELLAEKFVEDLAQKA